MVRTLLRNVLQNSKILIKVHPVAPSLPRARAPSPAPSPSPSTPHKGTLKSASKDKNKKKKSKGKGNDDGDGGDGLLAHTWVIVVLSVLGCFACLCCWRTCCPNVAMDVIVCAVSCMKGCVECVKGCVECLVLWCAAWLCPKGATNTKQYSKVEQYDPDTGRHDAAREVTDV